MTKPVTLRPEAEEDLVSARRWYDEQKPGLGPGFVDEAAAVLDRLAERAEMYACIAGDVRSVRLRRFPYLVYYRILPGRIEVLAVLHGSRDPVAWQERTR